MITVNTFAVPLSTSTGGFGTGFLGRRGGQVAFYTAAHVLTAIDLVAPTYIPIASWDWLAQSIEFQLDADLPAGKPVPVFNEVHSRNDTNTASREPTFAWVEAGDVAPDCIMDFVRFDLDAPLLDVLQGRFSTVELDMAELAPSPEDSLVWVGFPGAHLLPSASAWPRFPAEEREGAFLRWVDGHIRGAFDILGGMSGGPTFSTHGRFVGMVVGAHRGIDRGRHFAHARIVAAQDVLSV